MPAKRIELWLELPFVKQVAKPKQCTHISGNTRRQCKKLGHYHYTQPKYRNELCHAKTGNYCYIHLGMNLFWSYDFRAENYFKERNNT